MASINKNSIYLQFEKQVGARLKKEIDANIEEKVSEAKDFLIREIESDPVSKEISAGPSAAPTSGVVKKGNLFSYIGFNSDRNPIREIIQFLEQNIKSKPSIKSQQTAKGVKYVKQIIYVDQQQIEDSPGAQYDGWKGDGNNWIRGIRLGISGFANYLFNLKKKYDNSRSGPAVQMKKSFGTEDVSSPRPEYVVSSVEKFINRVKNLDIKEIFKVR